MTSLDRVVGGAGAAAVLWRAVSVDGASFAVKLNRGDMAAGLLVSAHLATGIREYRRRCQPAPTSCGALVMAPSCP